MRNDIECNGNVEDNIKELEKINKQLAKLTLRKEQLTESIIENFGHDKEGQKTYEFGLWKIEIRTPYIISLNKKQYESIKDRIPKEWNPVKESVSYSVDKKACEDYLNEAPRVVRNLLVGMLEKKPGKPGVVIKERV